MTNREELNGILDANIEQLKTMIDLARRKITEKTVLNTRKGASKIEVARVLSNKYAQDLSTAVEAAPAPTALEPAAPAPAAPAPAPAPLLLTNEPANKLFQYVDPNLSKPVRNKPFQLKIPINTKVTLKNPLLLKNAPEAMPTGHDVGKWKAYALSLTKGEKPNETTHPDVGKRVDAILKWAKTAKEAGVPPELKDDYNRARYSLIAAGSALTSTTGGRKKKRTRRIKYRSRH